MAKGLCLILWKVESKDGVNVDGKCRSNLGQSNLRWVNGSLGKGVCDLYTSDERSGGIGKCQIRMGRVWGPELGLCKVSGGVGRDSRGSWNGQMEGEGRKDDGL